MDAQAILKLGWMQTSPWRPVIQELLRDVAAGRMERLEEVGTLEFVTPSGKIRFFTPEEEAEPTPAEGWDERIERILEEIGTGRFEPEQEPEALSFSTGAGDIIFVGRDGEVI